MFGHRPEGRRVRDVDPIVQITPYLMPMRCDAQVFLDYDVEYEPLMRYIAKKSREGVKITFMEILIASFVRGVSQVLYFVSTALMFVVLLRIFSRNLARRQAENAKFLTWWTPKANAIRGARARRADKAHKYVRCSCGAYCRVPRGVGKIELTCPKCGRKKVIKT